MVRSLSVAAVSFVLIAALYFFCDGANREISAHLLATVRKTQHLVESGSEMKGLEALRSAEKMWTEQGAFLSYFADHQRLDAIGNSLKAARIALENGQMPDFCQHMESLKTAAESLYEAEAFLLKNVW